MTAVYMSAAAGMERARDDSYARERLWTVVCCPGLRDVYIQGYAHMNMEPDDVRYKKGGTGGTDTITF